ncbi:MAG: hypothetical protein HY682_12785 [Chloroflexi bacterium]|nr:hypothetical protein [Chloroflexota bacterium]
MNISIDLSTRPYTMHEPTELSWGDASCISSKTGLRTRTGGRIKRLERWLKDGTFLGTHGDGVRHLNLSNLVALTPRVAR